MKTIYKSTTGIKLEDFLDDEKNRNKIYNKRCFYIIKANMDSKDNTKGMEVWKIGVAGEKDGGTSAYGRLRQYIIYYGVASDQNPCAGARLYYLGGTDYNPKVSLIDSEVHKREVFMKQELKRIGDVVRGTERVKTTLKVLLCLVTAKPELTKDVETTLRRGQRNIKEKDKVEKVTIHETVGRNKTLYRVTWNRPFVNADGTKNYETDQTYRELLNFPNGEKAVDKYEKMYKKKFPDAKFNH
jgi:hypothetical protein